MKLIRYTQLCEPAEDHQRAGDRLQQTANGTTTHYTLDLNAGLD